MNVFERREQSTLFTVQNIFTLFANATGKFVSEVSLISSLVSIMYLILFNSAQSDVLSNQL